MIDHLRQEEFLKRYRRISQARVQEVELTVNKSNKRHVVYVMTHVNICGGVKIIFEHANRLIEEGWRVTIVAHFVKPTWYAIKADYIQVPFGLELAQGIPPCNIIVATYWDHIQACIETGLAPVVYFEQGDEHLFHPERLDPDVRNFVEIQLSLPAFIMTVSQQAAFFLKEFYSREAVVIPNAINHDVFNPVGELVNSPIGPYILMLGSDTIPFKRIDLIVRTVKRIKGKIPSIKLYWITPGPPKEEIKKDIDQIYINPSQELIAKLYRNAVMFISASEFESFSLPVLEAMACGCPVISANNNGVREYGIDGENILLFTINLEEHLFEKILFLLNNKEEQLRLVNNGLKTALTYNWKGTIFRLNKYFDELLEYKPVKRSSLDEWSIVVNPNEFKDVADYEKFIGALENVVDNNVNIPVIYDWIEEHPIARWETAAIRKKATLPMDKPIQINAPYNGGKELSDNIPLYQGISDAIKKDYSSALDNFIKAFSNTEEEWKVVCSKWIVICLIELERDEEAARVIKNTLDLYPNCVDIYYLSYVLNQLHGRNNNSVLELLKLAGDGFDQPEFFYELGSKIEP
ncbi:glycosyltransferase family 4 protein [Paenibacillus chitinolyticus]|uniref:glycosyltransferase family 4 protein n=1 Tax=Paenibacillus chitinolyticus TaxID=79263 RepID=UPI00364E8514